MGLFGENPEEFRSSAFNQSQLRQTLGEMTGMSRYLKNQELKRGIEIRKSRAQAKNMATELATARLGGEADIRSHTLASGDELINLQSMAAGMREDVPDISATMPEVWANELARDNATRTLERNQRIGWDMPEYHAGLRDLASEGEFRRARMAESEAQSELRQKNVEKRGTAATREWQSSLQAVDAASEQYQKIKDRVGADSGGNERIGIPAFQERGWANKLWFGARPEDSWGRQTPAQREQVEQSWIKAEETARAGLEAARQRAYEAEKKINDVIKERHQITHEDIRNRIQAQDTLLDKTREELSVRRSFVIEQERSKRGIEARMGMMEPGDAARASALFNRMVAGEELPEEDLELLASVGGRETDARVEALRRKKGIARGAAKFTALESSNIETERAGIAGLEKQFGEIKTAREALEQSQKELASSTAGDLMQGVHRLLDEFRVIVESTIDRRVKQIIQEQALAREANSRK
jgi:hypothetical protein